MNEKLEALKEKASELTCKVVGHKYMKSYLVVHGDGRLYTHKVCKRCWHENQECEDCEY